MKADRLLYWCLDATRMIRYRPDRKRVLMELLTHTQERKESFLAQGCSEGEATDKTIAAMGSPEEIAPILGQLHSPHWGYFITACRVIAAILAILCTVFFCAHFSRVEYGQPQTRDFALYDAASYGGDTGRTLVHLSQPNARASLSGNTFRITDAVIFRADGSDAQQVYFRLVQKSPIPWASQSVYLDANSILRSFVIRDSLGNVYYESSCKQVPAFYCSGEQSGMFSCTYDCWINNLPSDVQWLELCYERDGQSLCLRINLTGGGKQ